MKDMPAEWANGENMKKELQLIDYRAACLFRGVCLPLCR